SEIDRFLEHSAHSMWFLVADKRGLTVEDETPARSVQVDVDDKRRQSAEQGQERRRSGGTGSHGAALRTGRISRVRRATLYRYLAEPQPNSEKTP
ncbi:hypothetical protein, partial [Nocardia cerradoensis]|uniref:hypothetical protein n=1 Tax=Nocardia cerradoensis TaxID=85688 RepID=UPI000584CA10